MLCSGQAAGLTWPGFYTSILQLSHPATGIVWHWESSWGILGRRMLVTSVTTVTALPLQIEEAAAHVPGLSTEALCFLYLQK